jgi:penicillin V acylase-like amidase (Ntn superfamily)
MPVGTRTVLHHTVTIEYAGGKLVVFDDEYGVAKFMPLMPPQQEATEQQESTDENATPSEALKTSESAAGNVDQADVENN